ncbi:MAG: hypothetical protein ACTS6J_11925 [Burkholderiales bacterium]
MTDIDPKQMTFQVLINSVTKGATGLTDAALKVLVELFKLATSTDALTEIANRIGAALPLATLTVSRVATAYGFNAYRKIYPFLSWPSSFCIRTPRTRPFEVRSVRTASLLLGLVLAIILIDSLAQDPKPVLQQSNPIGFLLALKGFVDTEDPFDLSAVDRHFGVKIRLRETQERVGNKSFSWNAPDMLTHFRFSYGQSEAEAARASARVHVQIADDAVCVREADLFKTFGTHPILPFKGVINRDFHTPESSARFIKRAKRPVPQFVSYEGLGVQKLKMIATFDVFECLQDIRLTKTIDR